VTPRSELPVNPLVSIIILNYNGNQFLDSCLKEVLRSDYPNVEIILVDNGSNDGSAVTVMKKYAGDHRIRIVENGRNLGFAEGNNVGAKSARGSFLVFLNNDTKATETWLSELVKVAQSDERIGIVIPRILTETDPDGTFLGNVDRFGTGVLVRVDETDGLETIAAGPAFLVSREAWEKVGGFDPKYFMYEEDVDLAWRIKLVGYMVVPALKSRVYHSVAGTTRRSRLEARRYFAYRNTLRTLVKNYSGTSLAKTLPISILVSILQSTSLAWTLRDPRILISPIRAVLWNLRSLEDTWELRQQIQIGRVIQDHEIERVMTNSNPLVTQMRSKARIAWDYLNC
jgi:GT2 family glycosyltransferase